MATRRRGWPASLRLRLLVGAGLIAALAVAAAALAVWGSARSAQLVADAEAAQHRIDLLTGLTARVGDYAVMAVDWAGAGLPVPERKARLEGRAAGVQQAFDAVEAAMAASGQAGRGLGLARMRASFDGLARVASEADPGALRAQLDAFAALFAQQLDQTIAAERLRARLAEEGLSRQRALMRTFAAATAIAAGLLLLGFHFLLVRPLLGRLGRAGRAAEAVAAGRFDRPAPVDRHDELGLVFAQINRMAARLGRGQRKLERDRASLEATVAERTAELSAANDRLAATDVERRRLFADVGHELRTPLTVILAESDLAARPDADVRASLKVIAARARRLNRRIDDLLRVARSESGELELDAAPFDVAAAVQDAIEDVAPLARRARVVLAPRLDPVPEARGDRDWSRQVVAGVLDNAIRHSPSGGTIEVAVAPADAKIAVTVTDEGEGVAEADRDRIFERHVRGSRGLGFGVGLALARWVMERQGGAIALESPARDPGPHPAGTRVTLTFQAIA